MIPEARCARLGAWLRDEAMASYRGHLLTAGVLGVGYAWAGTWMWGLDWGPAALGGGLTALGGLLPDLDSDSGVPVRELFGLAAAASPILALGRLQEAGYSPEQIIVMLAGLYLFVRYGVSAFFKRRTIHRGMFHSIPALLIAGFGVFLLYGNPDLKVRLFVSGAVMLGFLSHLVLDELCAVDFNGVLLTGNKYAGSALKWFSPSWLANSITYLLLITLAGLTWLTWNPSWRL